MTEAEWLAAKNVVYLNLYRSASGQYRKWRLFGIACASRALVFIPDDCFRSAIISAEHFADGDLTWEDIKRVRSELVKDRKRLAKKGIREEQEEAIKSIIRSLEKEPVQALGADGPASHAFGAAARPDWQSGVNLEELQQFAIAHDIFGNPFRPVTLGPSWLSSTVLALARTMYESRDFSPMPILADALQDAGCDNEDVLNHCRGDGPHVRGCWVVDLILGKQ